MSRLSKRIWVAVLVTVMMLACMFGWRYYRSATTTSITAYFPHLVALYPGDAVLIAGVRVGAIDSIEPVDDTTRVRMHFESKFDVPADVTAAVLAPSLVSSRAIQLAPVYTDGPTLSENAVIPMERTQLPVEWDDLREQISRLTTELGPTPDQPAGPFGTALNSFADGLAGKGGQINAALSSLSDAVTTVGDGRSDVFATLKSLAQFVNTLRDDGETLAALNTDLAGFTSALSHSDSDLTTAVTEIDVLLAEAERVIAETKVPLTNDIRQLADVSTAILQPEPRTGLENALHVAPNLSANLLNIYEPTHGSLSAVPVINNFANPMQFLCSAVQAASRLGHQESAELCAQYLAPILDAIKFNYPPFGVNMFTTASVLPSQVDYSDPRLRPPPGFKDTTVPGIFARDTVFSRGNNEPGWVVAPGMEGVEVGPGTAAMLTPDSLAELMGSPAPGAAEAGS